MPQSQTRKKHRGGPNKVQRGNAGNRTITQKQKGRPPLPNGAKAANAKAPRSGTQSAHPGAEKIHHGRPSIKAKANAEAKAKENATVIAQYQKNLMRMLEADAAARKAEADAIEAQAIESLGELPKPFTKQQRDAYDRLKELYKNAIQLHNKKLEHIKNGTSYNIEPLSDVIGLDCEMIEAYIDENKSSIDNNALASVAIIRYDGTSDVFYVYYAPKMIKNDKFEYSGIKKFNEIEMPDGTKIQVNGVLTRQGLPFEMIQKYIKLELFGKRVVGHGLDSDFKALKIMVPDSNTWDTARIRYFMGNKRKEIGKNKNNNPIFENVLNRDGNKIPVSRKLKNLALDKLTRVIQAKTNAAGAPKGHNPIEDAKASLDLYKWAEGNKKDSVPELNSTKFVTIEDRPHYLF